MEIWSEWREVPGEVIATFGARKANKATVYLVVSNSLMGT
jgi:hypothetical protein